MMTHRFALASLALSFVAAHGGPPAPPRIDPAPWNPPVENAGSNRPGNRPTGATTPGFLPMPTGPGVPAAPPSQGGNSGAATTALGGLGLDLSQWSLWWDHNKAPYLALKEHVHARPLETGSDDLFPGGERRASMQPTVQQVREQILPALLGVLETSRQNDLVTSVLIALAKIGADGDVEDARRIESAIVPFLSDGNQENRETAAVSLGILASPRSIPTLANLLWDTTRGRELAQRGEVDPRTRAFAAYGLGLIGARTAFETDRRVIVAALCRALERDDTSTRDVAVACVVALSVVPLAAAEPASTSAPIPATDGRELERPESSRQAQLEYLLALLRDEKRHVLVRAQCPIALARLLTGLPDDLRVRVAGELIDVAGDGRELDELVQSSLLALGEIGTSDGGRTLDQRIRSALMGSLRSVSENQSRGFALIALARNAGRPGADPARGGLHATSEFLIEQLLDGKAPLRSWAGLACGVLGHELARSGGADATLGRLRGAVRAMLEDERDPTNLGAFATAAGLLVDEESAPLLLRLLDKQLEDETRGRVAVGLALMGHRAASEPTRALLSQSTYRSVLLRECAIGLGLLEDKDAAPLLASLLERSGSLATQASIAIALGWIGDERSVDPLLASLRSSALTEVARSYVAMALGNVADKERLPWNAKLALGLNYRAVTPTLSDPATRTGILDIL